MVDYTMPNYEKVKRDNERYRKDLYTLDLKKIKDVILVELVESGETDIRLHHAVM